MGVPLDVLHERNTAEHSTGLQRCQVQHERRAFVFADRIIGHDNKFRREFQASLLCEPLALLKSSRHTFASHS